MVQLSRYWLWNKINKCFISSPEPKVRGKLLWSLIIRCRHRRRHSVRPSVQNFFKHHLLINKPILTKFHRNDLWMIPTKNCSKIWNPCWILVAMAIKRKKNQNLLVRNNMTDLKTNCRNVPLLTIYQYLTSHHDSLKTWPPRGRGLFSIYIYIENLKKKLFFSETTGPILIWYGWNNSLATLYQGCSSHYESPKIIVTRGRCLFSLYVYIENFKNLPVWNHWTGFNIILQNFFFLFFFFFFLVTLYQVFSIMIRQKNMATRGEAYFSCVTV